MSSRVRSLYIVHFVMFVMSLSGSTIYTGLEPYLGRLDPDATLTMYGIIVAGDALGQMVFSPVAGVAADKMGRFRPSAIACSVALLLGNAMYSLISIVPLEWNGMDHPRTWTLFISRFIVGAGAAVVVVARGYVTKVTSIQERTTHLALVDLFQMLGFVLAQGLQAAFVPIGEGPIDEDSTVVFNMYTATGWVNAVSGAVCIVAFLPGIFIEHQNPGSDDSNTTEGEIKDEKWNRGLESSDEKKNEIPLKEDDKSQKHDIVPVSVAIYVFFAFFCAFVMMETLMTPVAKDNFGWSNGDTILYLSILMASGGIIAILCFAAIGPLSKLMDERMVLILAAMVPMLVGSLIIYPMVDERPPLSANSTFDGCEDRVPWNEIDPTLETGCGYCWCLDIYKVTFAQFVVGFILCIIGYPFGTALTASIYSKVLAPKSQGFYMGVLSMSSSFARVIGPIIFTAMYQELGTYAILGVLTGSIALSFVLFTVTYRRFIPFQDYISLKEAVHHQDVKSP